MAKSRNAGISQVGMGRVPAAHALTLRGDTANIVIRS